MAKQMMLVLITGVLLSAKSEAWADKSEWQAELLGREELNKLIDSLANSNPKPIPVRISHGKADRENPFYDEKYDWSEDKRVRGITKKLSQQDSETLFACLMDHLDDRRYMITYAHNGVLRIASIGDLCENAAMNSLQAFYWKFSPRKPSAGPYRPLRVMRFFEEFRLWYRDHKHIPLYQQQIELGETAIKMAESLDEATRKEGDISDEDLSSYIANIKKQLNVLRDTKKPLLPRIEILADGAEFYDEKDADSIRKKYLSQLKQETLKGELKGTSKPG